MKHSISITALLVFLFLAAQLIGLCLVYLHGQKTVVAGEPRIDYGETAIGARPNAEPSQIFWLLVIGVGIGTAILLMLIRFKLFKLWKIWFFAAVFLSLYIAFDVITAKVAAFVVALALAIWKVFRPNVIVHNMTELFVYGGIIILIAPLFNLSWAIVLLLVISVYDMFAVWKSKHMVTLAEASTENNVLAGLYLPKKATGSIPPPPNPKKAGMAVLGGGDIAFPLLFSSVVMTWLVNEQGVLHFTALMQTLIITLCCTFVLAALFAYSKKGKFYPAMPFLSLGCFVGLAVISIVL